MITTGPLTPYVKMRLQRALAERRAQLAAQRAERAEKLKNERETMIARGMPEGLAELAEKLGAQIVTVGDGEPCGDPDCIACKMRGFPASYGGNEPRH